MTFDENSFDDGFSQGRDEGYQEGIEYGEEMYKDRVIEQIKEIYDKLFDLEQENYTVAITEHRLNALEEFNNELLEKFGRLEK